MKKTCDKDVICIMVLLILLIMNVFIWIQDINKVDVQTEEKYKMVIEDDESKEFTSIYFIKIDEDIK